MASVSAIVAALLFLPSCFTNNPYRPDEARGNIYYDTFHEEPKHLDPAMAYSMDAYEFVNQIYEPVVQYHFLKRPYSLKTLMPLTAVAVPEPKLFDKDGNPVSDDAPADAVAKAVYEIKLKPGIRYQNHPCFLTRWHLAAGQSFPKKIEHPDELLAGEDAAELAQAARDPAGRPAAREQCR